MNTTFIAVIIVIGIIGLFILLRLLSKVIGKGFTAIIFASLCLTALGFLSANAIVSSIVTFSIGVPLSSILFCLVLRKIGKTAEKSIIASEIFSFITNYRIKSVIADKNIVAKEVKLGNDNDFKNIILVLHSEMGFTKKEAKTAAEFAMEQLPDAPVQDKIKKALQYLDESSKEIEVNNN